MILRLTVSSTCLVEDSVDAASRETHVLLVEILLMRASETCCLVPGALWSSEAELENVGITLCTHTQLIAEFELPVTFRNKATTILRNVKDENKERVQNPPYLLLIKMKFLS